MCRTKVDEGCKGCIYCFKDDFYGPDKYGRPKDICHLFVFGHKCTNHDKYT